MFTVLWGTARAQYFGALQRQLPGQAQSKPLLDWTSDVLHARPMSCAWVEWEWACQLAGLVQQVDFSVVLVVMLAGKAHVSIRSIKCCCAICAFSLPLVTRLPVDRPLTKLQRSCPLSLPAFITSISGMWLVHVTADSAMLSQQRHCISVSCKVTSRKIVGKAFRKQQSAAKRCYACEFNCSSNMPAVQLQSQGI